MTLAAAFSQAGSQSIVASLWKVSDVATRDFMVAFHRALAPAGRAGALQQAQLDPAPGSRNGASLLLGAFPAARCPLTRAREGPVIDMTLEIAEKAVRAAQARARELGTPMTVTVVDESGRLVLCARGNGTGFFTTDTSRGKAVAAANFRRPTKEMVELAREHPRSGTPSRGWSPARSWRAPAACRSPWAAG